MTPFDATLNVQEIEDYVGELRNRLTALRDIDWPVRQRDWSRDFNDVTSELDLWTHVLAQLPDSPPETLYRYDTSEIRRMNVTRVVSVHGVTYHYEVTE